MYFFTFFMIYIMSIIGSSCKDKTSLIIVNIIVFWLILHDGFRWETGTDWLPYYEFFTNHLNDRNDFEKGYVVFNNVIRHFTDNYTFLLLVHACFVYSVFKYLIKKYSPLPILSFFILYYSMIGYLGMNRQYIALCICFLSIPAIIERHFVKWALIIFTATLFHSTALLFLPSYFLNKKISTKNLLIILIIFMFIAISGIVDFFSTQVFQLFGSHIISKADIYFSGNTEESTLLNTLLGISRRMIWIMLFLLLRKKIELRYKECNLFFNLTLLGVALYSIFSGTIFQAIVGRGLMYYSLFEVFIIPMIFSCINKRNNKIILWIFICVLGLYTMTSSFNSYDQEVFYPYKAIYMRNIK